MLFVFQLHPIGSFIIFSIDLKVGMMKIALTYSSKNGLLEEYRKRHRNGAEIPEDFFAEGDSPETINQVIKAIEENGHEVTGFEAFNGVANELEQYNPDLVFNMAEGLWGDFRESFIPVICERLNLPYTGSDPLTLAVSLNKARAKEILHYHRIATPAFQMFFPGETISINGFGFPAIVKPVAEGSSKGIYNDSVVDDKNQAKDRILTALEKYKEPIMLEQFLPGSEFTVAVWGNGVDTEVLPIVSIDHSILPQGARPIYSYEAKWIWDTTEKPLEIFKCPATIEPILEEKIKNLVLKVYKVLRIKDWCRVDVRLNESNDPYIIELNPIPGILPDPRDNSCFPKAARTAGFSYPAMLGNIVQIAAKRYGIN